MNLLFSTSNSEKFELANAVCSECNIHLDQVILNIDEIQSENAGLVIEAKARAAFALCKSPVIVSDDSWNFVGLNGFPGVYMHSINAWFTPEDFINLTVNLADKRAILTQRLIYIDAHQQKQFIYNHSGKILTAPQGTSPHASHCILSLNEDNGLSIAEAFSASDNKSKHSAGIIWRELADWLTTELNESIS
jgi:inosine/xanthosine triphosphate pyrophosphatase family protein